MAMAIEQKNVERDLEELSKISLKIMDMSIMHLGVEACISPLPVLPMLYVITAIDPAIEVMIAGGRTCSPTATGGTVMISMEADIEDISSKDLNGTR